MKLLDKPLNYQDQNEIKRMLEGNIARICISDNPTEILTSLGFAIDRLSLLAYSRTLELNQAKVANITANQAQEALETIRNYEGVDPAYFSSELASAYELLEIYIKQQKQ